MSKEFRFTRKEFDAIRKMDRNSTEAYVRSIYDKGYEAGVVSCSSSEPEPISLDGLADELGKVRGIGVIKAKLVASVVESYIRGEG